MRDLLLILSGCVIGGFVVGLADAYSTVKKFTRDLERQVEIMREEMPRPRDNLEKGC